MTSNQQGGNALRRIMSNPELACHGIAAELAGVRSIKVSRDGRFLGILRHTVGAFDWYPAGYNQPQLRLPTVDHVSHFIVERLGCVRS